MFRFVYFIGPLHSVLSALSQLHYVLTTMAPSFLHMLLGISACFFLVVRLALAVFGCRHNRFKAMFFSPRETLRYMGGIITGTAPRYIVHNPGTSAAAIGMFLLVPVLGWTGLDSAGEAGDDIHAILSYTLLALIVAHMAGLDDPHCQARRDHRAFHGYRI